MGRLCVTLMFAGSVIALLAAALFQGIMTPGDGSYMAISSFGGGRVALSEPMRYLAVAAAGAVVGAVTAGMLYAAGARVDPQRRIGTTVVAGLLGSAVGVAPVLLAVALMVDLSDWLSPLVPYAISGAVAYGLAVAAVFLALRAVDDPATSQTVQAVAAVLPVGALLATICGVAGAWALGFATVTSTWIVVIAIVLIVLSATFAAGRAIGLRQVTDN
ncbi:hypothetical protein [Gordonia tangerina]|uniref:ABC transporter permease n=1 Tax=Gordonia tangerina TaxID=2911060 RepID=A0ABS9DS88_9ACTN|nr:hypothetical protein [Gordonia tangerina]MCF3941114.1 hypothetical protein [Gordonia tangerina]